MADIDFDDFETGFDADHDARPPSRAQGYINVVGALTSLALVLGVGVWGYKIAVRDVTGVPVVRALKGAMRISPETPGGEIAAHQGLSVNQVTADGVAAPVADRLVLAPRPVDLVFEDTAGLAAVAPPTTLAASVEDLLPTGFTPDAAPLTRRAIVAPGAVSLDMAAPEADLAEVPTPPEVSSVEAALQLALLEDPVPDTRGGIARSPRPLARPMRDVLAPAVAAGPVEVTEIDPATLTAGTRLVQLGAYDDVDAARKAWDRLAGQFGELLTGKARVVQSAQSGGRTFFRLRAHGFENADDARRFCSAFLAENAACIPVAVR